MSLGSACRELGTASSSWIQMLGWKKDNFVSAADADIGEECILHHCHITMQCRASWVLGNGAVMTADAQIR